MRLEEQLVLGLLALGAEEIKQLKHCRVFSDPAAADAVPGGAASDVPC